MGRPKGSKNKPAGVGHNSGGIAGDMIRSVVERIERLEEEKRALLTDIREVYAEAKSNGFDVKTLRQIIRLRKQDIAERAKQEALLETYMHALGMLADLPLGQAAVERNFGDGVHDNNPGATNY